ncbi:blocked early in transport 1 [Melampsora americana]|nr:blocked early in transport 1 [Melampsora americana]
MNNLTHRGDPNRDRNGLFSRPSPSNSIYQSTSPYSSYKSIESLESQNDHEFEGLSAKISINIGTEVKESSNLISKMNDSFSEATGLLSGTFKKMNKMSERQTGRWWYWMLFLIIVFWVFVLTWLWRH